MSVHLSDSQILFKIDRRDHAITCTDPNKPLDLPRLFRDSDRTIRSKPERGPATANKSSP